MANAHRQRMWDTALGQLELHVTRTNYDTWLKEHRGVADGSANVAVGVDTEFLRGSRLRECPVLRGSFSWAKESEQHGRNFPICQP